MKICLVSAFPPSRGPLGEYALGIARELQRNPNVELTVLADELTDSDSSTNTRDGISGGERPEMADLDIIRCWKFGSVSTPVRLLRAIRRLKPDVVWFHLVFSSFGTSDTPVAAFAGLTAPALVRAAGFYTHVTLHQIVEHVDFAAAGVHREKIYRAATSVATRALLKADSVSVLLSGYRRILMEKYAANNILLATHGIFTTPTPASRPDFTNRDHRILAFGNWGTYKRLETLMAAFPSVLQQAPNAKLIVAGGNHPAKKGYWESVRNAQPGGLPIEFRGYIPREDIPELFRTSSVLVMPYNSATGSSGPAHQACEYGLPIVCADIPDFRDMAASEGMAVKFYRVGDANDMVRQIVPILESAELQRSMSEQNFEAGIQMSMEYVVRRYLRWFELKQSEDKVRHSGILPEPRQSWLQSLFPKPVEGWDFGETGYKSRSRRLKVAQSNILSIDFRNQDRGHSSGRMDEDHLTAEPTLGYASARQSKYSSDR